MVFWVALDGMFGLDPRRTFSQRDCSYRSPNSTTSIPSSRQATIWQACNMAQSYHRKRQIDLDCHIISFLHIILDISFSNKASVNCLVLLPSSLCFFTFLLHVSTSSWYRHHLFSAPYWKASSTLHTSIVNGTHSISLGYTTPWLITTRMNKRHMDKKEIHWLIF